MARGLTYKDAGIDLVQYDGFIDAIQKFVRRTHEPRVIDLKDGFAGLFSLRGPGMLARRYKNPVLAACTDGVGTKLKIAFMMDKHDTVGIDLVAMSVNDLLCVGAEPLFFLDYLATGKLDPSRQTQIVKGISDGCIEANCALIGGETAEMTDFYGPGEYDLAGFAVGVAERNRVVNGRRIAPKDVLIGVSSSGVHSNGYSLVRKVFFDHARMTVNDPVAEFGCTLGEELLKPTRIYARPVAAILNHYKIKNIVHGLAHITGGGLRDNVERILPKRCQVRIEKGSWPVPPVFDLIARTGSVDEDEMYRVFNMGIGLVLIVPPFNADTVLRLLKRHKETACIIGEVKRGKRGVEFV